MTATIIVSVILAFAVTMFTAIAMEALETNGHLKQEDEDGNKKFVGLGGVTGDGWGMALGLGVLTGVINFFSQFCMHNGLPVLSLIMAFVMLALMVAVVVHWLREGSEWRELWPFLILILLLFVVAKQAALAGAVFIAENQFWSSVVKVLPRVALFAGIGTMVAGTAKYRYEERRDLPENTRERNKVWFYAATVLTILALLLTIGFGVAWGSLGNFTKPAGEAGEVGQFPHYYNLDIQNDGLYNDYNFGPNPWIENYTAAQADAEFRKRLKADPMLGAADISWLDAKVGTQYLGDFYEKAENNWARAINNATEDFSSKQTKYYETLDPFFAFLDSAIQVSVRDCQAVEDQMYANPHTNSGIPEVVVYKTTDHSGHELVYTFSIKGNVFEVAYRIECGFQPTNVEKAMNIPAQDKPSDSTPTNPSTNPSVNPGSDPTPTPTPTSDTKDPSKLPNENTEPNDNTGPGEITINPSDSEHSSKDTSDGSNSYNSYDEYVQEIEEKRSVNETQSVGGDSNKPSTSTPAGTNVDNNGDAGTGNGGIDTATPTQEHAQTSNGESISNTESNPAGAWGDDEDPK